MSSLWPKPYQFKTNIPTTYFTEHLRLNAQSTVKENGPQDKRKVNVTANGAI